MKQLAQSYRTGKLELTEVARPAGPPAAGILVETTVSLISAGTERMLVDLARKSLVDKARERPDLVKKVLDKARREGVLAALEAVRAKLDSPIPLGYSLAGRVAEVGKRAPGFARGDRVACAGAGFANHAEVNAVPRNLAVHVPDEVSDDEAAFVTVGAIALQGVRLSRPQLGEVVVVIGLGLIGQIAVQLLHAHGCDVVGVDIDQAKVDRAIARGAIAGASDADDAAQLVRTVSRGHGADAVVITASSPTAQPIELAGDLARDRARVSIVGMMPLTIPRKAYYEKELEVVVSRSYGPGRYDADYEERGQDYPIGYVRWTEQRNMQAVLRAIARRRLDVKSLVTHRFAFDDVLDAYALITGERPEPHLGVLLGYARPEDSSQDKSTPSASPRREKAGGDLGVAVVGTGSFATGILLPALAKVPGALLVRTVSGRGLSARHAADKFGADGVAASLDEALALPEVDVVVIATRHDTHARLASGALAAGRDVFLEKPAAIDEEQLASLARAVQATSARLMVGFNRRFAPFARGVREAFSGRRAGLVMSARINAGRSAPGHWTTDSEEGGGRVVGEVCHFVDLLSFWAGAPPVRVSAHAIGPDRGWDRADNLAIALSFADGSVGTIAYTAMGDASVGKERYEIIGEGRIAVIDDWRTLAMSARGKTRTTRALKADKGHATALRAFIDACRSGAPSPLPWDSIAATTRATLAAERAWREGTAVEIDCARE